MGGATIAIVGIGNVFVPADLHYLQADRHALHAARIVFPHPGSGQACTFDAPLPADLTDFIEGRLRNVIE